MMGQCEIGQGQAPQDRVSLIPTPSLQKSIIRFSIHMLTFMIKDRMKVFCAIRWAKITLCDSKVNGIWDYFSQWFSVDFYSMLNPPNKKVLIKQERKKLSHKIQGSSTKVTSKVQSVLDLPSSSTINGSTFETIEFHPSPQCINVTSFQDI